jgi:hypothetical protein
MMTEDEWYEKYKPIKNHLDPNASWNGEMFETYGEEIEFVKSTPDNFVWTLLDVDGESIITNGQSWVNRMGYFVCEVPWNDDEFHEILIDDDEEVDEMLTKDEMLDKYTVKGFAMGWAIVERKEDNVRGTLDFDTYNGVRYYSNFKVA